MTNETGAAIPGATISVRQLSTNLERQTQTNNEGRYQIAALDVGSYRLVVRARGFRTHVVERLRLEVGRTAVQDFSLSVGELQDEVIVTAASTIAGRATFTAGHLVDRPAIETTPLNGQHFVDLAFDARHRFVTRITYELFSGGRRRLVASDPVSGERELLKAQDFGAYRG